MAGAVAVDVAEGAVKLSESHFHRSPYVGYVLGAEDDEGPVPGSALGVAGELDLKDLAVRRFDRLVGREDMRAGSGARAEDADRTELLVNAHLLVHLVVYVRDHEADRVPYRRADEFSKIASGFAAAGVRRPGRGLRLGRIDISELFRKFVHYFADQFIVHLLVTSVIFS